ncbi:MAG TPA: hypothetical protein VLM42_20155, partial [Bryobacteraceae bacterium]|nr:hypothetical protein [Bryobacteraceae bacterium]
MRRTNVLFLTVMLAGAANCFATLIPISAVGTNLVPTSGAGYGSVSTLLNANNSSGSTTDGLESNCNLFTNSVVTQDCGGPFTSLGLTIHDAGNQNHAQSLGSAGITNSGTAAQQILLVFNTSQTGPHTSAGESITLDALGLALWYNGNLIFSAVRSTHDTYDTTLQGVGQAGFGYKLDATQAAAAQLAINAVISGGGSLNDILVTGAFKAGCLTGTDNCGNDGPETLFLDAQGGGVVVVPEPLSLSLVGGGLLALGLFRKR